MILIKYKNYDSYINFVRCENTLQKNWNYIRAKFVCNSQKSICNHFTYRWKSVCNMLVGNYIRIYSVCNLPTEYYIRIYSVCNEYCLKKLFTFFFQFYYYLYILFLLLAYLFFRIILVSFINIINIINMYHQNWTYY